MYHRRATGKKLVDGALGKQIMREHVPLATRAIEIHNRVDDFPHIDLARPAATLAWRDQRLQSRPLHVGQIARISFAY